MHGGQETPVTEPRLDEIGGARPHEVHGGSQRGVPIQDDHRQRGNPPLEGLEQRQQLRLGQRGADHQTPFLQRQGNRAMGGIDRRGIVR